MPKLQVKGGDSTSVTRVINEWLQETALSLNTWSSSAVQLWHHAVATTRAAHQQWTHMAPSQREPFRQVCFYWPCSAFATVSPRSDNESRSSRSLPLLLCPFQAFTPRTLLGEATVTHFSCSTMLQLGSSARCCWSTCVAQCRDGLIRSLAGSRLSVVVHRCGWCGTP